MSGAPKRFTDEQKAVAARDANAVVSAGAGSGKTTVLVERYARLVEERGFSVDSILALTFTRKAAAEMQSRIHARLAASEHPNAKAQLELFDTARISTLDAFCSKIARGACTRYGLPPDFAVDEDRLARIADETAVELLMERKEEAPLRRLVAAHGFDRIRYELFASIAADACGLARPRSFADEARLQAEELRRDISAAVAQADGLAADVLAIPETEEDAVAKAQAIIRAAYPLPDLPGGELDAGILEALLRAVPAAKAVKLTSSNKSGMAALKETVRELRPVSEDLAVLIDSYRLRGEFLEVGKILDDLARRIIARKRREGVISFKDAADLAMDILVKDPELRGYYKKRIKAIMIDEFQDNNELQKELLYLLAEREDRCSPGIPAPQDLCPDKLFFVGDEKQSIYRFRGADVAVFRSLASELDKSSAMPTGMALSDNHRSSARLVRFFNSVFPGVFGEAALPYEASFKAIGTLNEPEPGPKPVEFHIFEAGGDDDAEGGSPTELVADALARRIADGAERGEFAYGDVAVLFRSTSKQDEYERAMRAWGIPYAASDPRGVFAEGPANDFYNLLRLALFPRDRNAYAAVLRSPFVRLGDDALARIFLSEPGEAFSGEGDPAWFVRAGDAERWANGRRLLESVRADADRVSASALVARLWYDEGYRAELLDDPARRACAGHFDRLYDLALDADSRRLSLSAFLDELAPFMGSSEKIEGDSQTAGDDAVVLMTVHKSKGLEFPVVAIADAGSDGKGVRNDGLYYDDPKVGFTANLRREEAAKGENIQNWFFRRAKEDEKRQGTAELRRQLYVAATRAERALLVFGTRKPTADSREDLENLAGEARLRRLLGLPRLDSKTKESSPKSFLDFFAEGFGPAGPDPAEVAVYAIAPNPEERAEAGAARRAERREAEERKRALFAAEPQVPRTEARRLVSPTALELARGEERGPHRGGPALPSLDVDALLTELGLETFFGTLCHLAADWALQTPERPFQPRLPFPDELPETDKALLVARAVGLAKKFAESPIGKAAGAARRKRVEYPFLLALQVKNAEAYVVNGQMDLIFETETGFDGSGGSVARCVVVDFKTDKTADPEAHAAQLACYRAAASSFSDLPAESWLYHFRSGEAQRVDTEVDLGSLAVRAGQPDGKAFVPTDSGGT